MITYQKYRIWSDKIIFIFIYSFSILGLIPFLILIRDLIKNGMKQINYDFFTHTSPSPTDAVLADIGNEIIPGGILNGIFGSIYILAIATIIAAPLGIMAGIYISENRKKKFTQLIQGANIVLYGMPSIIIGICVYVTIVKALHGFSALAGGIALAISMLPFIIRTTKETLKLLPGHLKESGMALGGSYIGVMSRIILPAAWGGLFAGILITLSRTLGKTTPLLITAVASSMINWEIDKPTATLSLLVWKFFNYPNMIDMMWSTALFLFIIVISLNIIAKQIGWRWKMRILK
jgi:phosphate transport system permease protein